MNNITLPATIILAGATKSGKSYFCKNTLMPLLKGQYTHLVICSPNLNVNHDFDFVKDNDKNVFKVSNNISTAVGEMIDSQKKIFEMREMDLIKDKDIPRILCILDDCIGESILRGERSLMARFGIQSRHYYMSFVIMTQRIAGLPRQLRINAAYMIAFSVMNYTELERLVLEYCPKKFHKQFQKKLIDIYSIPFNFLFIDNFERKIKDRIYVNGVERVEWE